MCNRRDYELDTDGELTSENQPTLDELVLAPGDCDADRMAVLYWASLVAEKLPNYAAAIRERWGTP